MLISRGIRLAKNIAMFASKRVATNKIQVRNSGNRYTMILLCNIIFNRIG